MNHPKTEPCYVLLRTDDGAVTIKLIMWTREDVEAEVSRLNALNGDEHTHYDWVLSRAVRR